MEQKSEALYSKLTKFGENDWNNQDRILEKISMLTTDAYSQKLADDVIKCFSFENTNHNKLSKISKSLIAHKYQWGGVQGNRHFIEYPVSIWI